MKALLQFTFYVILLICPGLFTPSSLLAQNKLNNEQFRIDLQFGIRNIQRDSLPNGADIDFMNYLYDDIDYSDYQFIDLGFTLIPSDNWAFNVGLKMLSDLQTGQLSMSARYFGDGTNASLRWGIGSSFNAYPQYLEAFNNYHILMDTGFTDLNPNFRQITLYDLSLDIMPFLTFSHKRFQGIISSGVGLNSFVPFKELITQKKTYSNLRREIRYETHFCPSVFSRSEIEAGFDLFKGPKKSFGITLKAGLLLSNRRISYSRTTVTWIEEQTISEDVKPDKKLYTKSDLSWGIYLKF